MKRAFSLIELLIVVAIIVIMTIVSMASFNGYNVASELNSKAEEIKGAIEKAHIAALNPQAVNNGSRVYVDTNSSPVKLKVDYCKLDNQTTPTTCTTVSKTDEIIIPNYFSISPAALNIYFSSTDQSNQSGAVQYNLTGRPYGQPRYKNIIITTSPFSVRIETP